MWVRSVILTAKQVKNRGVVLPSKNNITNVIINSNGQVKPSVVRLLSNFKADADQKKVIEHMNPQAFVIAGPGTGKTHCAIGRVQHLIESNIAEPEEILVLTTADKTAANIQYQIDLQTPLSKNTSTIRSWITMSYSFLQEFKDRYRSPVSEVKAASFMERGIFFQEHFKELGFNLFNPEKNPLYHTNAILNYFTRLQEANVTPEKYQQYVANLTAKQNEAQNLAQPNDKQKTPLSVLIERHMELSAAYAKFINLKWNEKKFDHLDVMMAAMKMFEERPDFVEEIRTTFPHVIVDEVQDINPITLEFIKLLGSTDTNNRTMTLFGDDDLAIFRWRGAIPNVFDRLADHFPNAAIYTLPNNYRSPAPILTAARNLITKNSDRMEVKRGLNKLMTTNVPDTDGNALVEHFVYDTRHQEVTAVVQMVQTILKNEFGDKNNSPADIEAMMQKETNVDSEEGEKREPKIVLAVRSKNEMLELSNALREAGVSFVNKTFNQKINMFPEVQFLLNFLIALVEPSNAHVLYQLLGSKMYSFPSRALAEVTEDHVQNKKTLRQALKDFSDRPIASIKDADMVGYISKARRIIEDLEYYEKAMTSKTTMQIIYEFLKKNKLLKSLRAPTTQLEEQQGKNIAKFLKLVGNVERKLKTSLPAFVIPYLKRIETLWSELVDEEEISPVALTTLWNLRNNEYDYVIFSGATNDSTPGRLKQSDLTPPPELTGISIETAKEYQEEERRLVYMLLTRAKKKFIFTNFTVRDNKNKAAVKFSSHNPSKFIAEALGQPKVSSKKKAVEVVPEPAEPTTTAKDFFKKTGPITLTPNIDKPPTSLTFDQIRIFDRCPLHYYYQYVLKMPIQPTFLMAYQTAFKNTLTALFENERSFEAKDESGEPKRTFNFLELMHKFNDDLKTQGFPNVVEVDPKKYSAAMAALEEYFDKDYEGFKGINQPFSIKIDLKASLDQFKNQNESNSDQSFTITGNFHRVFEDNEVHHFYTYTEGYIPEEQVKFVQSVLALAYYQTYNLLPRKVTTEFINHNFYTIKKLKLSPDMTTIEETYKLLQSLANNVRQSVFQAQPSFSKCLFCNFNPSCPSAMLKNKRK